MTATLLRRPDRPAGTLHAASLPEAEIRFEIVSRQDGMVEARLGPGSIVPKTLVREAIAFVEALTAQDASLETIRLRAPRPAVELLIYEAAGQPVAGEPEVVDLLPDLIWQIGERWLGEAGLRPYPLMRVTQGGRGHPLRPPKPHGTVYRRRIPWLDRELSFRTATQDGDAALLNGWMNEPRVAAIWDETGPIEHHAAYLQKLLADPHMLPLIGLLDGVPFGWFEVYFAAENRLGSHYPAEDWDRGWHVAIGDEGCRGAAYVSAWLPSLMHFIFLDEPRTRRIVGEPRADHRQQIRNLERSGFATVGTVDFPHKRAALVMLTRDRFFRDHLWAPGAADASLAGAPRLR